VNYFIEEVRACLKCGALMHWRLPPHDCAPPAPLTIETIDALCESLADMEAAERAGASSTGGSLKLDAVAPVTFAPKGVPLKLAGKIPDLPPAPEPWSVEALGYDAYAALAAIPRTVEFAPRAGEVVAVKDWLAEHVARLTHLAGIKLQEDS
jgi:hypothetical protein